MSLFGSGNKPKSTVADKLGSIRIQSQGYGNVIPLVFGTGRVAASLVFYSNFTATPHVESVKSGGKGGKKKRATNTTFTYSAAIMLGVAGNNIQATGKLWLDKKIYTSVSDVGLSVFNGSETQLPWGYLSTYEPDKAVALRGFAYLAANNYPLSDTASLGNHSVEVLGQFCSGTDGDANPADIIRSILMDYCGIAEAQVADFALYRAYCAANDLLFSLVLDSQRPAGEVIAELLNYTGAELVKRNGVFDIIDYSRSGLDSGLALSSDDFIADHGTLPVKPTRAKALDAFNTMKLEFINRANDYNIEIAEAKDAASIETIGVRPAETIKAHCVSRASVASNLVHHLLTRGLATRNTYEFSLSLRYIRLEPMDVITLTDTNLGLTNAPVIIKKLSLTSEFLLKITAEDYAGQVYRASNYTVPAVSSYQPNTEVAVGNINPPVIFSAPAILTATGYELWCAISSTDPLYGGCDIYVSIDDGVSYKFIGSHEGETRMGTLTANFVSATGLDTIHTLAVNLSVSLGVLATVSQAAFDTNATLCRVAQEFLTYRDVLLTSPSAFNLSHCQRGLYGSTTGALTGDDFIRCDDSLFKFTYDKSYLGKTIKLKFVAHNKLGGGDQDLATVPFYAFAIPSGIATTNASAPTATSQGALITASTVINSVDPTDIIGIIDSSTGLLTQISLADFLRSTEFAFLEVARETTGTTPLLVAEFTLPAGVYTQFTAVMGTASSTDIATLEIKNTIGTVLSTLVRTGIPLQMTTGGFTLAVDTLVGFYLHSNTLTSTSYIFSLGVK